MGLAVAAEAVVGLGWDWAKDWGLEMGLVVRVMVEGRLVVAQ